MASACGLIKGNNEVEFTFFVLLSGGPRALVEIIYSED